MSLIFDALQRSEAERSGVALSALAAATEVLQLAELHEASERETAVQFEHLDAPENAARDTSSPPPAVPQTATAIEAPVDADLSVDGKYLDAFSQIQSLQVVASPQNRLVCLSDNESLAAEKFRYLGVRLQHLRRDQPLKKVLITSTIPAEGKSVVAANLACTLARRTAQRTLLLEGDLRRPSLSQMFGLEVNPGICEWLQGGRSLTKSIYYLEGASLWIFPAGSVPKSPLELLQSGKLPALMDQLTAWFDWIIIDSPPVLPLADTSVWMRVADGILLIARQGTTEKRQLQRGLEALEPKKLIGALLNESKSAVRSDYYYRPPTGSGPSDKID